MGFSFEMFEVVLYFTLSVLVIAANLLTVVALRYLRTAKKATIIFLSHLAICNLVQGIIYLLRGLFLVLPVLNKQGCMTITTFSLGSSGAYVTGILYVYLDLYLALKKLSLQKPVISMTTGVVMVIFAWMFWIGVGVIGQLLSNKDWVYVVNSGCSITADGYKKQYVIAICVLFLVMFVVILACHVGTLQVMKVAHQRMAEMANSSSDSGGAKPAVPSISRRMSFRRLSIANTRKNQESRNSKWLKKNTTMVRIILIVLIIFGVCWYPTIIVVLIQTICDNCIPLIAEYIVNILVIIQYLSNGFIYLAKSKEFQQSLKRVFRCVAWQRRVEPLGEYSMEETVNERNQNT